MLMRFDPIRDIDRVVEELTGVSARGPRTFPMDAYRRGDEVVLLFDLPGVDPESIDLTVDQHVLTVRAQRTPQSEDGIETIASERPRGEFIRRVFLGDTLDTERVSADYHGGVLRLTIPISERAKPRKIEVAANGQHDGRHDGQPEQQPEPVAAGG
jgi:HSP20 family protein